MSEGSRLAVARLTPSYVDMWTSGRKRKGPASGQHPHARLVQHTTMQQPLLASSQTQPCQLISTSTPAAARTAAGPPA